MQNIFSFFLSTKKKQKKKLDLMCILEGNESLTKTVDNPVQILTFVQLSETVLN